VAGGNRLRFRVADQDGARQMVRASLPDVLGEAMLLCGGEAVQATRLTEQTFAWLGREVRGGRETVTLGRLLLVLRHHFLEELHPAGRRRRRVRAAERALGETRRVILAGGYADAGELLAALPQLARAVPVLRHVDRMLAPDVAAALRVPDETAEEIDRVVLEALEPLGGLPALRAAVSSGPPPVALAGRVVARLVEALTPTYVAPLTASGPAFVGGFEVPTEAPRDSRRVPGLAVALAIIGALAAITAGRHLATDEPPPAPAPCTTAPRPLGATLPPLAPVSSTAVSSPPGACPAP
jgi:hypothetical protein